MLICFYTPRVFPDETIIRKNPSKEGRFYYEMYPELLVTNKELPYKIQNVAVDAIEGHNYVVATRFEYVVNLLLRAHIEYDALTVQFFSLDEVGNLTKMPVNEWGKLSNVPDWGNHILDLDIQLLRLTAKLRTGNTPLKK